MDATPNCPKCGGLMFDETRSKFWNNGLTSQGKKKPRYKCRDKGTCDGIVWGNETPKQASPANTPQQGGWPGPPQQAAQAVTAHPSQERLASIFATYRECFAEAVKIATDFADEYPKEIANRIDIPAMAATLMIQAHK